VQILYESVAVKRFSITILAGDAAIFGTGSLEISEKAEWFAPSRNIRAEKPTLRLRDWLCGKYNLRSKEL